MHLPFFSVIIPSYNRAKFLPYTISSVLKQSFTDFEIIIIDDASSDNSKEVVESFNDNRIIYSRNEKNIERGASRNKGIEISKGKYICFLDSDDEFLENHLDVLYKNILKNAEPVSLFFTGSFQKINNGDVHKRNFVPISGMNIFYYLMKHTFNPSCVAIHRDIFDSYLFDPKIPGLEDIDLWLHIALKFPLYQINEYTILLNFHEESYTSGDSSRFEKELKNFKYIFQKQEFKKILPLSEKRRLLSMCYYHIALKKESENKKFQIYSSIIKSFFLCPSGYNKRTNKIILVMFVYHLPILGNILKRFYYALKNKENHRNLF